MQPISIGANFQGLDPNGSRLDNSVSIEFNYFFQLFTFCQRTFILPFGRSGGNQLTRTEVGDCIVTCTFLGAEPGTESKFCIYTNACQMVLFFGYFHENFFWLSLNADSCFYQQWYHVVYN